MIVLTQTESKQPHGKLDGILSMTGITVITGGPHDLTASLRHPVEPDHPECQHLAADAARRAHAARKTVQSDMMASTDLPELLFGAARTFATTHRQDAYVPPQAPAPARRKAPATPRPKRRARR